MKISLSLFFALFSFLIILTAQHEQNDLIDMQLHILVDGAESGESFRKTLRNEKALDFDVASFLNDHQEATVKIFGRKKTQTDYVSYAYDSSKAEERNTCGKYCEKIVSIERVPYLGVAVVATEDFSGVTVTEIIPGGSLEGGEIVVGDVITSIQTLDISNPCELTGAVNDQVSDETIEIEYLRDGDYETTYIKVGHRVKKNITWVNCCDAPEVVLAPQHQDNLSLQVFPNPTEGITQFNFQSSMLSEARLNVTDISGRPVLGKKIFPLDGYYEDYVDLSKLPSGVYLINIEQEGKKVTKRVVLQRE